LRLEREERKMVEKQYQLKLDELQLKLEKLLKEQEKELRQINEAKTQELMNRHQNELVKYNDLQQQINEKL